MSNINSLIDGDVLLDGVQWRITNPEPPGEYDNILSQPIRWETDNDIVKIEFVTGQSASEIMEYNINELRTGYDLLGAIYTFFNSETDLINVIKNLPNKESIIEYIENNPTGPYRRIDIMPPEEGHFNGVEKKWGQRGHYDVNIM